MAFGGISVTIVHYFTVKFLVEVDNGLNQYFANIFLKPIGHTVQASESDRDSNLIKKHVWHPKLKTPRNPVRKIAELLNSKCRTVSAQLSNKYCYLQHELSLIFRYFINTKAYHLCQISSSSIEFHVKVDRLAPSRLNLGLWLFCLKMNKFTIRGWFRTVKVRL